MQKNDIITKLRSMTANLREELKKNDGSTLQTISSAIAGGYDNVRAAIAESDRTKKALTTAKQYLNEACKAVKSGDRKLSAKTLDALDKLLKEHKEQEAAEQKKAPANKSAAKTSPAKKTASSAGPAKKPAAKPDAKSATTSKATGTPAKKPAVKAAAKKTPAKPNSASKPTGKS